MTTGAIDLGGTHAVAVAFSRGWWTARVPGAGVVIRVRRLDEADAAARELLGAELGLAPETVQVRIVPDDDELAVSRRGRPWSRRG